jgi:hypothetical protein
LSKSLQTLKTFVFRLLPHLKLSTCARLGFL